jgi:hypothetical protein
MSASNYARLAAAIFALIALLQLSRALFGWEVSFLGWPLPVWPNWIAFVVAAGLAWLGWDASRK